MQTYNSRPFTRPKDLVLLKDKKFPELLRSLLYFCTPHPFEKHIERIIRSAPGVKTILRDSVKGNIIVKVGKSRTIFSAHMDIVGEVSKKNAKLGGVDAIALLTPPDTEENRNCQGFIFGAKTAQTNDGSIIYTPSTLGADDKVGCFILLKMIEKGIPGTYIFHTAEEIGGQGSAYLASSPQWEDLFEDKDRAIAFDRAGYGDVIGFQRGGRCCSIDFGRELAQRFTAQMPPKLSFSHDIHGTFTDTASYTKLVPECTNISVGYFSQHGTTECLDWYWLMDHFLPAVLTIDFESLPTKRDPKVVTYSHNSHYDYTNRTGNYSSSPKVNWKDAKVDTPFYNFPEWEISMGLIPGVEKEVIFVGVTNWCNRGWYGERKDKFINNYIDSLEFNGLLLDEIRSLKAQISALHAEIDGEVLPEQKKITVVDIKIHRRKEFMNEIIKIAEDCVFKEDCYRISMDSHLKGAKKFVQNNLDKMTVSEYNAKDLAKMNKFIAMMAYLLCCRDTTRDNDEEETIDHFIEEIYEYVTAHNQEPGFRDEDISKAMGFIQDMQDREKVLTVH